MRSSLAVVLQWCACAVSPIAGLTIPLSAMTSIQGSTHESAVASKALTTSPDNTFPGTCARTSSERRPWWRADLGTTWSVDFVRLTSRCCVDFHPLLLVDIYVTNQNIDTLCASNVTIDPGATQDVPCSGTGSKITVQFQDLGYDRSLVLCGFLAFGTQATQRVQYGDMVFLKTGHSNNDWYLSGGRAGGNFEVRTSGYEQSVKSHYRWQIRSNTGDGSAGYPDPRSLAAPGNGTGDMSTGEVEVAGPSVRYGDVVFLQVQSPDHRWLTGGRDDGDGNKGVYTRDHKLLPSQDSIPVYHWRVRSDAGNGAFGDSFNPDPRGSQFVEYGDPIFLQVESMANRWLTGGRDNGNTGVFTRNHLDGDYEQDRPFAYQWQMRSDAGDVVVGVQEPTTTTTMTTITTTSATATSSTNSTTITSTTTETFKIVMVGGAQRWSTMFILSFGVLAGCSLGL